MPFDTCFIEHLNSVARADKAFSQGTGMGHFDSSMTTQMKSDVSLGYCYGASINWLKLSLVVERAATMVSDTHSGLVTSMAKTQLERIKARTTARNQENTEIQQFHTEIHGEALQKYQAKLQSINDKFYAWLRRIGCTVRGDGSYSYNGELATKINQVKVAVDEAKKEAKTDYDQEVKLAKSQVALEQRKIANARGHGIGRNWDALKKVGAGAYTGDVVPVIADDARWDGTIDTFICRAVSTTAFKVGRGMVFIFKTGKDPGEESSIDLPPGHAIGLRRLESGKYQMFDPNLGVYTYKSRASLIYALLLLLTDGYNKREIDTAGKSDEWIVFCKTADVIPDDPEWQVTSHEGLQAAWVERDKVKQIMRLKIESLVKTAFEKALAYQTLERTFNIAEAQMKENGKEGSGGWSAKTPQHKTAFDLAFGKRNAAVTPLNEARTARSAACAAARVETASINTFVRKGGKVADTGLAGLLRFLGGG